MHNSVKCFLFIIGFFAVSHLQAQIKVTPTDQFVVEGKIKKTFTFSISDAAGYRQVGLDSIAILNHLLQRKNIIKQVKGILLKDVLSKIELDAASPKLYSAFYFECIAADNYKVVFSWNELFNTFVGNQVIIVTEKDGKKGAQVEDRIVIISAADHATGRRYVKGLTKIIVKQVD
jgi:hypothetical protein